MLGQLVDPRLKARQVLVDVLRPGLAAGVIERPLYAAMLSAVAVTIAASMIAVRYAGSRPSVSAAGGGSYEPT